VLAGKRGWEQAPNGELQLPPGIFNNLSALNAIFGNRMRRIAHIGTNTGRAYGRLRSKISTVFKIDGDAIEAILP
jgi:hypothetical protein